MKYQWSFAVLYGCLSVGFVLLLLQFLIGGAVVLIGVLQEAIFYRCPHCHASLLRHTRWPPNYCPNCGEELFN